MPLFKIPIHVSYLLYLGCYSPWLAKAYFRWALRLCQCTGTEISLLLHPLDFLGGDDVKELDFFPAMSMTGAMKVSLVGELLDMLARKFTIVPMGQHAQAIGHRRRLPLRLALS
jgi:hypothetical protein